MSTNTKKKHGTGAAVAPALWAVKAHFTGKPDLAAV